MRQSEVTKQSDSGGEYEIEIFGCDKPKRVIVTVHGNGVRRWDGADFFYSVANHFTDSVVMLVDQNQQAEVGVVLSPLNIMVSRVQNLLTLAKKDYPDIPVIVMAHSMGCGVTTQLDLGGIDKVIFVTPATDSPQEKLIERFGPNIANGMETKSSDGYIKIVTPEHFKSLAGINWETEYQKLLSRYSPVHAFEAGDEEIVSDTRFTHRDMAFASYTILEGATHNLSGKPLQDFFEKVEKLI